MGIVVLDEQLSNQIAAGEVVERPASVVKELVENSIDANSSIIKIEIEDGGLQSIKVTDNGNGIDREDCVLAFERHATSKIKNERDLFSIRSLGFRGEAIPSIASVSKIDIKTCVGDGPGTHIIVEAGELQENTVTASRKGTEVTVTQLFFNTPARLKYLKTVHTELGNITDIIYRLALAHPEISFHFFHNHRQIIKTNGGNDLLQVASAIYGLSVAKKMIPFKNSSLDFEMMGLLAKPEETRASRKYISLFVNGRYIRNYTLANAVIAGYHTLLPIGRFPISVIHIKMNPTLIDVNVHPSKLDVRLSKEKELTDLLTTTIRERLQETNLIPEIRAQESDKEDIHQQKLAFQFSTKNHVNKEVEQFVKDDIYTSSDDSYNQSKFQPVETSEEIVKEQATHLTMNGVEQSKEKETVPPLYPVGQIHGTYIIAQNDNGLYLIDQHAAQERIKYEFYRDKLGEPQRELQDLMIPLTLELNHEEAILVEENLALFHEIGLFFEQFGDKAFIVRSHPTWFPTGKEEETIRNIVDFVLEDKKVNVKDLREDTAIMMSCKLSIKANQFLDNDDMFALLQSLRACEKPYTCPHGRPVMIHFSAYELEKMFKRVM